MNKQIFSLLLVATLIGCASTDTTVTDTNGKTDTPVFTPADPVPSTPASGETNTPVSGIAGREWKLIEVYINGAKTRFNRSTLPAEIGNFFTLNFDAQNISGVGAPNRYSAPYTLSERTINIMVILSTKMASLIQPENLTEQDFLNYLQNVHSWRLANNNLELLSTTQNGGEVRLVFSV